ncbi:MAG: HAMP domain-containing sensor histidine kinase [Caldilineaceae bacterium]
MPTDSMPRQTTTTPESPCPFPSAAPPAPGQPDHYRMHRFRGRWGEWSHGEGFARHSPEWRSKRRFLMLRFMRFITAFFLLIFGGLAALNWIVNRLMGHDGHTALLVWILSCGIALALPAMAITIAMRAYRGMAAPLANVMTAADAVASGDLSARVPERAPGEFGRLATSFNRMASELERNDEQRRNLTADIAHELRTPLHIIQGNLEGILDGVYEPTTEHIEATLEETRALARLVEDLRVLAQAEMGQLPLVRQPFSAADFLADLVTSFGGQAEAAGIDLRADGNGAAAGLRIVGDVGRLDQVMGNLLVNALRHTPSGGSITLAAKVVADGVQLRVTDTGEGIPAADLPYIFDRFWRGDRARSHKGGVGGGLGLAIARQLVQAHGGRIEVESEVGQGTEFRVVVPGSVA